MRNYIYILPTLSFKQCQFDPCVFYKWKDGNLIIITVYVDDLILMVDKITDLLDLKADLSERFRMKDLGKLSYCLGLSVMQRDDSVTIHQRQYIDNLVARFNLTDANTVPQLIQVFS